jgi:hypothetical protein
MRWRLVEPHWPKGPIGATKVGSAAPQRIFCTQPLRHHQTEREIGMAKGKQKGNREAKKPKKEKVKTIAAAPSQKIGGWQPALGFGKKK